MKYFALFLILASRVFGAIDVKSGATDVITYFVMRDATAGTRDTGITIANVEMYYIEDQAAESADAFVQAHGAVTDAHTPGEVIHVGHGVYRVDWPDAAFDGGIGKRVQLTFVDGDAGAFTETLEVLLSPPANLADEDHTINSLTIDDDTGDAVTIITRGGNGNGVNIQGNGSGDGVIIEGGATGNGLQANGGATSGDGIVGFGQTDGDGIVAAGVGAGNAGLNAIGNAGNGILATGSGSGFAGLKAIATVGGSGIEAVGNTNGDGMVLTGAGTGSDLNASLPDATWQEMIELLFSFDATGAYGDESGSVVDQIADNSAGGAQDVWEFDVSTITGQNQAGRVLREVGGGRYGAADEERLIQFAMAWARSPIL